MNRILDKTILLLACLTALLFVEPSTLFLIAFLCAVVAGFLGESKLLPDIASTLTVGCYLLASLFIPEFSLFIPLMAYNCFLKENWFYRLVWVIPLIASFRFFDLTGMLFLLTLGTISILLAWRALTIETELGTSKALRDTLREESLLLETKNRDLRDKQDMEIHLAMLNERGRIAREIHDNVGHLLTRSIVQVEAFKVVHKNETDVYKDFNQVGDTLHEALDTVRTSVHDLHDDAFDLHTQLQRTLEASTDLAVELDYSIETIEPALGYCLVALTREALSNTLKHSNADHLRVAAIEQPGFYRLTLADNGTRPAKATANKRFGQHSEDDLFSEGIGLRSMDERVRSLGGVLRTDNTSGFKITASFPKKEEA